MADRNFEVAMPWAGTLVIVGIALIVIGEQGVVEYQSLTGKTARALSDQHQTKYRMYSLARAVGVGCLGLGLVVLAKNGLTRLFGSVTSQQDSAPAVANSRESERSTSKMIQDGEEVIHRVSPSWTRWTFHIFIGLISVFYLVGAILLVYVYLAKSNTEYIVTSERIVVKSGILSERYHDYWLTDIQGARLERSRLERLRNLDSLRIDTKHGTSVTLRSLPNAGTILSTIQELHDTGSSEARSGSAGSPTPGAA